jgi:alkaline phosphatase
MRDKRIWQKVSLRHLAVIMAVVLIGCTGTSILQAQAGDAGKPKNIIILFADGVASSQLEVARYASHQLRNKAFTITDTVLKEGHLALLTNNTQDTFITDSAAAGSAMSTGVKTTLGTIALTPEGQPVDTVMKIAKAQGKRIGLVSTGAVYDATPAAFSVNAKSRREYEALVNQYVDLEPDVLLGAGYEYFLPDGQDGGKRKDGKDVIAVFREKGYEIARSAQDLRGVKGPRVLGLFAAEDMSHEIDRHATREPSVAEMAEVAIRVLSEGSPNGFVLLLETENTDKAGHRNDIAALLKDLGVFDQAVQIALEFQRNTPTETLIIVTGDHETGGLSPTYALKDLSSIKSKNRFYPTAQHLAMIDRIDVSMEKAAEDLGKEPTPEALDKLVAEHFPGFQMDPDLQSAVLKQDVLERNFSYPTQCALSRMVSRQTGFYWGTSGHSAQPVVAGSIGPGAERFRGYMDNTDFGKTLHSLLQDQ